MEILRFLEGLRTPWLDAFFATVTHLGEETLFIVIGLVFYWCIHKKEGYYLLSVGLIGTVLNQFLKLLFRIPRPWVKDPDFTIVESARAEATGYSFPSGHTQSAVGIFAGIARWNRQVWVRVVCIVLAVLVPISRMYLGVHTPMDVGVSTVVALILVFGLYPLLHRATDSPKAMRLLFGGMTVAALLMLLFVHTFPFPADVDVNNLAHGTESAYKMLGCIVGLFLSFELDHGLIRFDTKAVWWVQVLKLVLGLIPILLIKSLLKQPLYLLVGNEYIADGLRYFLIAVFAGCIWPITFRWFAKLGQKNKSRE